ncbi:MAG: acetyl-CoA carboxylase biotin carboxyl carrier protein [Opitutales bacterium]
MDIKEIKQVIDLMKRYELTEFELEEEAFKIRLRREPHGAKPATIGQSNPPFIVETPAGLGIGVPAVPLSGRPSTPTPFPGHVPSPAAPAAPIADEPGVQIIKSPMVGTFYRSPTPDAKPFVEDGAAVTPETVVCIIEAMKVMNEIQAEIKGTIKEVLVENGKPVEYGQPLFKIKVG